MHVLTLAASVAYYGDMDDIEKRQKYQRDRYRLKVGYADRLPFPSLVRDCGSFGAVLLIASAENTDLLVDRWLCRGVDEATARAAIEEWKEQH